MFRKQMTILREVHADAWCVRLDLGHQVLHMEVPEFVLPGQHGGPPLSPVLPHEEGDAVSAATLLVKAKQFDDGLYAAVELGAQQGAGRFPAKAGLLRALAANLAGALPEGRRGATRIYAACALGGLPVPIPEASRFGIEQATSAFRSDFRSTPLGFYTWTKELAALFRQDRFLQFPLDPEESADLAHALERTPGAMTARAAYLRLMTRMTNPSKGLTRWDAGKCPPFFPPSRSHEVALFERLFESQPVPEGFDLMRELICRIRFRDIDLTPGTDSGWYDHQTWSLEPLLIPDRMPEGPRLEMGVRYRTHLENLFRGTLALMRETHVKQLAGGAGGFGGPSQRPIVVHPALTVEPLPSLYARRAACYRFIREVLVEAFGADAVARMHRLTPEGPGPVGLMEELDRMETLFEGAAATSRRELGMEPDQAPSPSRLFAAWRSVLESDRDVSRDVRMMVPVFYDFARRRLKVWAFLGWQSTEARVEYRQTPDILTVRPESAATGAFTSPPLVLFGGDSHRFAVPVVAEIYVSRLLDRDQFRKHCDRFRTRFAILANLK